MPIAARVPDELTSGVFRGSEAVRSGLLTGRQLRGSTWRRLVQDVYAHRDVPVTHLLRAQAALALLPSAVVTGKSAAALWGVPIVGPDDYVEVTLPPRTHMVRVEGLYARRAVVRPTDVGRREGLRVTTPAATALRLASVLPRDAAVAAVDQLIAARVVDLATIRTLAAGARGPGSARARLVAGLADGLAASPPETRLRLLIGGSTLPPPVAQFTVIHDNRFVGRVDFAWPDQKVALEYDGLWHAENGQFARDRERLNRLREAGWQVVFVTAADLGRPEIVLARIARALGIAW
jgi:G:T-mismatch repair DNA endonuclease (very short patch repair protein)